MRAAYRALVVSSLVLPGLGLLAACGPPAPSETFQIPRPSSFDTPLDNRWRKASEARPVAILLGRAETTQTLLPRKAVLRVSCNRRPFFVRVSYDVGLKTGPIAVAYRFNAKAGHQGEVRVRGSQRNMLVIDDPSAVAEFQAGLRSSNSLKVRASRLPFEMHDAYFQWDPGDKVLNEVLDGCKAAADARRQPNGQDADDEIANEDIPNVLSDTGQLY
jgi:hypothetical protein